MSIVYGFVKCQVASSPIFKAKVMHSHHHSETQYHLHANLTVPDENGQNQTWDTAVNVGTDDSDDLLTYKLVYDFNHPVLETLRNTRAGFSDLTDKNALPAFDFLRSDLLAGTGPWRTGEPMDGSETQEPAVTLKRLLEKALQKNADVYIFGRTYTDGALGIHDVHMNQGSNGGFLNIPANAGKDHNEIWQDGAVLVDFGDGNQSGWAAYFTAFMKQNVPTDDAGNPDDHGHQMTQADDGSLVH